ncbi:MAG: sigma-70 family RNA polymerase sigma factor [Pyrinomonadaceae bacterium]|nr:sigma-70 family RNA polymerase sigma factor [Pyrinomonadaceae bacterium]
MTTDSPKEVSLLLSAWSDGDHAALDKLVPLVYDELHRLAHRYISRERPDNTLQTTALAHEAYLRLVDVKGVSWQNRAHFFAVAAQMMRRILVDLARARQNLKRGGGAQQVSLDGVLVASPERDSDMLALDEALSRLAALNPRQSQVVELRYFGGLTDEEVGEVVKVSPRTVRSDWRLAKVWLYRELSSGVNDDS